MENSLVIYVAIRNWISLQTKQHKMDPFLFTSRQCIKESNAVANIAAMKQHEKYILQDTESQCMKKSIANIETMKQL